MPRITIDLPDRFAFSTEVPILIGHINYGNHLDTAQLIAMVSEARVRYFKSLGYTELDIEGVGIVVADVAAGVGTGTLAVGVVIGILVPLLLWYFIARRASNVAKWIFVVLTAVGLLGFLSALANPMVPKGLVTLLGAAGTGLQVYGAWLLFRPDAAAWLDAKGADGAGDPEIVE